MKIIVDAMGGDNAPDEIVKGAINAIDKFDCEIILTGIGVKIFQVLENNGVRNIPKGLEIVDTTEVVYIDDDPATVIRQKKDSSLVVGLTMLRDGRADAFVSAGSTGALLSGATLIVKRIRGIRRAALAPFIPNSKNGFILIDCGANAECTSEYLLQFAYMGSYYAQDILSLDKPRVGLLNNGAEKSKGTPLQLETYELLEKAHAGGRLNFVGNVEPSDAIKGACDVLVCDGFNGNILLKTIEGTAKFIMSEIKSVFYKNLCTKICGKIVKKHMGSLREKMNPDAVGGTALLGISKPVIKAHGSSNATAIVAAIGQAISANRADTASRLAKNIDKMKISH